MSKADEIWKLIGEEAEKEIRSQWENVRLPGEKTFVELKTLWKFGNHKTRRVINYLMEAGEITRRSAIINNARGYYYTLVNKKSSPDTE